MPMLNTSIQHNNNPSQGINLEKEIKCFQFGKKERKLHLFTEDMTLCVAKSLKFHKKLAQKFSGYKISIQISSHAYLNGKFIVH